MRSNTHSASIQTALKSVNKKILSVLCLLFGACMLCACGKVQDAPADAQALEFEHSMSLDYATQFRVDYYKGGYKLITIHDETEYLLVPEGAAVPDAVLPDTVLLFAPLDKLYLVSSSQFDFFRALESIDSLRFSGSNYESWAIPEAKAAMDAGSFVYAGKYSAPDYELILSGGCSLAIENTMIYHSPEVKEQLEFFKIPVLVEYSSYESEPLARMEWIKLYAALLGKESEAEEIFDRTIRELEPVLESTPTGRSAAFFSVTSNNLVTVRKGEDYVARMIELSGGEYVFSGLENNGNKLATMNISLESFYDGARDADILIYNSVIEGEVSSVADLIAKCPMLADFNAVRDGNVFSTGQSLFQQTMSLGELMLDMNAIFTDTDVPQSELIHLNRLSAE